MKNMKEHASPSAFQSPASLAKNGHKPYGLFVVRKAEIEAEIERLCDMSAPDQGARTSQIIHPDAAAPGFGFAPGTDVTLSVLNPGERSINCRSNANRIEITLSGEGTLHLGSQSRKVSKWGVFTIPSMQTFAYHNDSDKPWVRLTYSNAPVLKMLHAYFHEEFEGNIAPSDQGKIDPIKPPTSGPRARDLAVQEVISEDGAEIRGYEWLIDLDPIDSKTLYWPWEKIAKHLPSAEQLSSDYNGRRVFLLYNPATGEKMGTSQSFFATVSSSPESNNYIPHRHTSSAINYYLRGKGYSKVEGQRVDWEAGDLLLSAPSWQAHSHHSQAASTSALTIQDHPFHMGMHSLIWQERMNEKILTLAADGGFETNRAQISGRA